MIDNYIAKKRMQREEFHPPHLKKNRIIIKKKVEELPPIIIKIDCNNHFLVVI